MTDQFSDVADQDLVLNNANLKLQHQQTFMPDQNATMEKSVLKNDV